MKWLETNSLMDVLASFLLLRMTYREGTGPETFSGEDSKPDYRHIEPGCRVIRGSTILGMERNRPEKGALGRGMQWERSSLGTAVWEQGNEGDGQWQSVPGQRSQEEQSGWVRRQPRRSRKQGRRQHWWPIAQHMEKWTCLKKAFSKHFGCASSASLCYRPLRLPALPGTEDLANLHRRIRGEARAPPAAAAEKRGWSGRPDLQQ